MVVVDAARHVVGIIADSDLISRVSRETWPGLIEILASHVPIDKVSAAARKHVAQVRARTAAELMTPDVVTVHEAMPVESALALSAERRIKRLPVVNSAGVLVGIVGAAKCWGRCWPRGGGEDALVIAILWVGLGGFSGRTRVICGGWAARHFGTVFPYGTFVINVTGSFILGFFLAFIETRPWVHPSARLLFSIGFVGAYTTFSTFTYESMALIQRGELLMGGIYVTGSVLAGLFAVFAGIALGRAV